VTVRVGHVASTEWAPLYVALDRGYFSDLNVKVELVAIRLGQRAVDLVGRDQIDAVVTDFGADVFNGLAAGQPFRIVGSMPTPPAGPGSASRRRPRSSRPGWRRRSGRRRQARPGPGCSPTTS